VPPSWQVWGPDWPRDLAPLVGAVTGWDGDEVPWDGPLVRVVRHSAHCPGHSALWVERAEVLIAGDMLSDIEIPLPDSEGISGYLRGLRLLEPWVRRARVLVPGHGRVAVRGEADSPESRLALDLAYLSDPARATGDPRLRNAPE
jgi:Zn-dependent hydrolases, including glyoxylases